MSHIDISIPVKDISENSSYKIEVNLPSVTIGSSDNPYGIPGPRGPAGTSKLTPFNSLGEISTYAESREEKIDELIVLNANGSMSLLILSKDGEINSSIQQYIKVPAGTSPQMIFHGMNRHPKVMVIDSTYSTEVETIVSYLDPHSLTVSWNGSLSGWIYLI